MFQGSYPAMITPFRNGQVDYAALEKYIEWHIEQGTNGLVPVGTTGESPTLSHQEHMDVVSFTVNQVKGRIPVIAGAGSNATAEAVEFAKHAQNVGANGILVVAPYYNKPTPEGVFQHFKAINDNCALPVFVYNIPGRSIIDIKPETMARLFHELEHVKGVKDATAQLDRVSVERHIVGKDFIQFSGEDATALAYNAAGGQGCISVTANIAPKLCAQMQEATLNNDFKTALEIQDRLLPLHSAMFCESSPAPAKYALSRIHPYIANELRLPLLPASPAAMKQVDAALEFAGVL